MATTNEKLRRISAHQAWAFTTAQARAGGVGASALNRFVGRGEGYRLHPSTYVFAASRGSIETLRWAALLAAGDGALITGEAALDSWGLERYSSPVIEIVTAGRRRAILGATLIQSGTLVDEDCDTCAGRPTAVVERAVVDVAHRRSPQEMCRALVQADFRGLFDAGRMERTIERNRSRAGIGLVREAFDLFRAGHNGVESSFEDRFVMLLTAAGVTGFTTNVRLQLRSRRMRPDVYFPEFRLIVQVDPAWHMSQRNRTRDAQIDAECVACGFQVIRVPGDDLELGVRMVIAAIEAARDRLLMAHTGRG